MLGSVLMLASILYLHSQTGSFDYVDIVNAFSSGRIALTESQQFWLFLGFFAAFAVKVPIFPLHTWLPDTYTRGPHCRPLSCWLPSCRRWARMGCSGLL